MRVSAIIGLSGVVMASSVHAAVMFDSTAYVTGNQNFNPLVTPVTGTSNTRAFGSAVPSSGYTGPAFSAGYTVTANQSVTGLGYNRQQVENNATNDFIHIQAVSTGANNSIPANTALGFAGVVYFPAAATFDLEAVSLSATATARSGANSQTGRYLVNVGGTYYLSNTTFTLNGTINTFTFNNTSPNNWAVYDPTAGINFDQASASFAPLSLAAVQGVGVYAEIDSFNSPNAASSNYTIANFTVRTLNATAVIPEPTTLAGLSLVSASLLCRRSR